MLKFHIEYSVEILKHPFGEHFTWEGKAKNIRNALKTIKRKHEKDISISNLVINNKDYLEGYQIDTLIEYSKFY